LAIGPRVIGLGEPALYSVRLADHVEAHRSGADGVAVSWLLGELDAVIHKNGADLIGHSLKHVLHKLPSSVPVSSFNELGHSEIAGSAGSHEEIELAFSGSHLGDVEMEEPDGVAFELLASWFALFNIQQARNAVPLQAPVQRRPCRVRDGRLMRIETIVWRQQHMASECDDRRALSFGQNCCARFFRTRLAILDHRPLPRFGNRLGRDD
jgi:hypothetical protein